jgi:hypothetical protein
VPSLQTSCVHIRRNDIDRKNTKINGCNSCVENQNLIDQNSCNLYLSLFYTAALNKYSIGPRPLTFGVSLNCI